MPSVRVMRKVSPRGLPMAATLSPTIRLPLSPKLAAGSPLASIFSTATSLMASAPTSVAS